MFPPPWKIFFTMFSKSFDHSRWSTAAAFWATSPNLGWLPQIWAGFPKFGLAFPNIWADLPKHLGWLPQTFGMASQIFGLTFSYIWATLSNNWVVIFSRIKSDLNLKWYKIYLLRQNHKMQMRFLLIFFFLLKKNCISP